MADIRQYLCSQAGVCVEEIIIIHLPWDEDLLLISDSGNVLQKQLNGLLTYCARNLMISNEMKTNILCLGRRPNGNYNLMGNWQKELTTTNTYATSYLKPQISVVIFLRMIIHIYVQKLEVLFTPWNVNWANWGSRPEWPHIYFLQLLNPI